MPQRKPEKHTSNLLCLVKKDMLVRDTPSQVLVTNVRKQKPEKWHGNTGTKGKNTWNLGDQPTKIQ